MNTQIICKMFIKNIEEYNLVKKQKILIVFDDMIADITNNKIKSNSNRIIYQRQKIKHFYAIIL